jgi:hypothetical protein
VLEIVWRSSVIAALSTAAGAVFDGVENVIMERRGRPKLLYSSRPALTDAQVLVGLLLSFATLAVFVSIDWDDPGSSPWLFVDGVLLIAGVLYWWWTIRGRSRGG